MPLLDTILQFQRFPEGNSFYGIPRDGSPQYCVPELANTET
jgi:hypothetical protein